VDSLLKWLLPDWVTVFMLHRIAVPEAGIGGLQPAFLARCLELLRKDGYEFISLEEAVLLGLEQRLEKRKWVAFSLDDGCREQVEVAGEIFARYDCPSTCFLITDYIDGKLWEWEHQLMWLSDQLTTRRVPAVELTHDDNRVRFDLTARKPYNAMIGWVRTTNPARAYELVRKIATAADIDLPAQPPAAYLPASWDAIRRMEKRGMNFAAHTATHRIVSGLSDAELEREVMDSIARVNAECERAAPLFCYPSGRKDEYDSRIIKLLQQAGILAAFVAEPGYLSGRRLREEPDYRYLIPRMTIPESLTDFRRYVSSVQFLRELMAS
jgi:peptidoglycan/xylan/chitin deacetylase (PgdA/CDA1 family)